MNELPPSSSANSALHRDQSARFSLNSLSLFRRHSNEKSWMKTFPDYREFPMIYFRVETNGTADRIVDSFGSTNLWSNLVLDNATGANVLTFSAGYGDGCYDVTAHRCEGKLAGFSIEFIEAE
jgi:hypothetical protein